MSVVEKVPFKLFPLNKSIDNQLAGKAIDIGDDYFHHDIGTIYLPEIGNFAGERIPKRSSSHESYSPSYVDNDELLGENSSRKELLDSMADTFGSNSISGEIEDAIEAAETGEDDWFDDEVESTTSSTEDSQAEKDEEYARERYGNAKVASTIAKYYELKAKKDFFINNLSTLLPITLVLSIYGIYSLVPGDCFRVDYLPKRYQDLV